MLADQIRRVTVVIVVSRPQIAMLDFDEGSAYSFPRKERLWITCLRSARRNEAIASPNHDVARTERHQTCVRLGSSEPVPNHEDTPEQSLTLQLYLAVRLDPKRLRITDTRPNVRARKYTANDHFHGRLPVKTSHSKPRVLTNSHLWQAVIIIVKRKLCNNI